MIDPRPPQPPEPRFDGILRHARQKAEDTLREYRAVAGALFERHQSLLTDRQRGLMGSLLRQIVGDIEVSLHQLLLAGGEGEDWVVRETMETVHRRGPSGAYDRLADAGALSDLALTEAVIHRLYEHQLDRALRQPSVHAWPGGAQDEDELFSALAPDAPLQLRELLEAYAVDRSLRIDGYGNPVLDPVELPPALAEQLHWLVAAALRETLPAAGSVERARIDRLLDDSVNGAIERLRVRAAAGTRAAAAAEAFSAAGMLDCELALKALRHAAIPLFEALLIRLTELRPVLVRRLLYETGGESLAVAMRAVGASGDQFVELYSTTRRARTTPRLDEAADLDRLLTFFERVPESEAALVCGYWRRDPALQAALWRLGLSGDVGGG